jgi:hypothetical protein
MIAPNSTKWRARLVLSALAGTLAGLTMLGAAASAHAFWIGGGPCCGYWGPGAYWGYPPPYAYYPSPAAYPPPAYPAPAAYPPPTPAAPAATAQATPAITYTSKPAFTNSVGQTCREYKTGSNGRDIFGTACRQSDGQWRVVN